MTLITEAAYAICAVIGASVIWMMASGYRDHFRCKRYAMELEIMNANRQLRALILEAEEFLKEMRTETTGKNNNEDKK